MEVQIAKCPKSLYLKNSENIKYSTKTTWNHMKKLEPIVVTSLTIVSIARLPPIALGAVKAKVAKAKILLFALKTNWKWVHNNAWIALLTFIVAIAFLRFKMANVNG